MVGAGKGHRRDVREICLERKGRVGDSFDKSSGAGEERLGGVESARSSRFHLGCIGLA
jgi:hypothetical protein